MKPITFTGGGMLAGLANMLALMGYDTSDQSIACGMEAPYLFVKSGEEYQAGSCLYHPQWLNLYLHPRGFHMHSTELAATAVPACLRQQSTAMLRLRIQPDIIHPVVFSGYNNGRYEFINIRSIISSEPETLSYSVSSLKRRLDDCVAIYTLQTIEPEKVDFLPLLYNSLKHLTLYQTELLAIRHREVTRSDFHQLQKTHLRALMQDLLPMAALIEDELLYENLRKLNHYYKHVFTQNSSETVWLDERLPKKLIVNCIEWMKEDIRDRLCELNSL